MLEYIYNAYRNFGYELCVIGSIFVIFILYLYNLVLQKKGMWSAYKKVNRKGFQLSLSDIDNNTSKGELRCKFILEDIFRRPFLKIRPDILRNDVTDQNLELDLFNEELMLAVEYNGIQHYKFSKFFHTDHLRFREQQYRDQIKRMLCE